jgi:hypothetical protein
MGTIGGCFSWSISSIIFLFAYTVRVGISPAGQDFTDLIHQAIQIGGLYHIRIRGPGFKILLVLAIGSAQDDRHIAGLIANAFHDFNPAAARHFDIKNNQMRSHLGKLYDGFFCITGKYYLIALVLQLFLIQEPYAFLIIYD